MELSYLLRNKSNLLVLLEAFMALAIVAAALIDPNCFVEFPAITFVK